MKSTYSTACAMDLCGFTVLCLLCPVSVTFVSMEHILNQNRKRISFRVHPSVYSDKPDTATRRGEKKRRIGLPSSHSRQITEERCTIGAAVHVKMRFGSC